MNTQNHTQHTPGPWRVLEPDQVRGQEGEFVANCECHRGRLATDRANARLIAAAPDLLEALGWMVETFNAKEIDPMAAFATIEKARAAIAKAKGGA